MPDSPETAPQEAARLALYAAIDEHIEQYGDDVTAYLLLSEAHSRISDTASDELHAVRLDIGRALGVFRRHI